MFFRRYVWKRPHWYCERPHWYEHCHRSSLLSGRQSPCWKYQRSFELLWTELDIQYTHTNQSSNWPTCHAGFHSVARCKTSWGLCGVVWADILRPRVKFRTSGTKHWQPANGQWWPMAEYGMNMVELKPNLNESSQLSLWKFPFASCCEPNLGSKQSYSSSWLLCDPNVHEHHWTSSPYLDLSSILMYLMFFLF